LIGIKKSNPSKIELSLHNLAENSPEVKNHVLEKPEIVKKLLAMHQEWSRDVNPK
jgi:hypothetical protein